jgi:hypothetical protein
MTRVDTPDAMAIRKIFNDGCKALIAGKAEQSIGLYSKNIVVYDLAPPRRNRYEQVSRFSRSKS